jgi:hypothetical protein
MVPSGLLWAVVLVGAAVAGPVTLVVVLVPVVLVAAASALRLCRVGPGTRPLVVVLALAVPVAGLAGAVAWAGVVVVVAVAIGVAVWSSGHPGPLRVVVLVCGPAAAAGAVVATAHQDTAVAVILVVATCLFDAGNFVVGIGDTGGRLGAAAGSALVAVLMVGLSALVDASLHGRPIWVLSALLVVLLPAGVAVGRRATGPARLPAFRRLDSLILAGPACVVAVALLVRH